MYFVDGLKIVVEKYEINNRREGDSKGGKYQKRYLTLNTN
jgi:hypothetical protein